MAVSGCAYGCLERRTQRTFSPLFVHVLTIWNTTPRYLSLIHYTSAMRFPWRTRLVYYLALLLSMSSSRTLERYLSQVYMVSLTTIWFWLFSHASLRCNMHILMAYAPKVCWARCNIALWKMVNRSVFQWYAQTPARYVDSARTKR